MGSLNPFRYRGYYYDIETKLYYLISRYYDPETGRFISADSIEYLDPETLGGLNLYAYCENNPVMGYDPDGTFSLKKLFKKIGNGLAKVGNWINDNIIQPTVNFIEENRDLIVAGLFFVGAAVATVFSLGSISFIAIAAGAIIGSVYGALNSYLTGGVWWQGAITGFVAGAFGGINAVAGGFAAAGMSVIMDRVNGKEFGRDTVIRAIRNGIVTGIFSAGANYTSQIGSAGEGVLVKWIVNLVYGSIFTLGNMAYDLTVKKMKEIYGR